MDFKKHLDEKTELYDILLQFIEKEEDDYYEYQQFLDIFEKQKIQENKEELKQFLQLLLQISNNHHRFVYFFIKIEHILQYLFGSIKQKFTNNEIFNLFKSNKSIVLFLIKRQIIIIDINIVNEIINLSHKTLSKYHYFFYPEIKEYLNYEELLEIETYINNEGIDALNFDKMRLTGENEKYICEIIRKDSVIEFISYVNRINLSLNLVIKTSIFETNSFLIKNEPNLIEYASFYGSIQIFQYLKFNNVQMEPILWLYTIHSQNPEIIHLLEENFVEPPNKTYQICFDESVKCHHNNIANYFKDNYLESKINDYKKIFKYYNYDQIKNFFSFDGSCFYYLCFYNYSKLVELYLEERENHNKFIIITYINII